MTLGRTRERIEETIDFQQIPEGRGCLIGQETCAKLFLVNRDQVIATLRTHESELRAAGIVRLSLFGSTVRGEERSHSDIDLLAAFDEEFPLSLIDVLRIQNQIGDLLGQSVDLVEEGCLKPRLNENVNREAVRAF